MLRKFAFLSAGAVAAALAATPSMAGETNAPVASSDFGPAPGPLYPPYAQAQAYIGQACAPVSNKGFVAVSKPIVGVCCLTLGNGIQLKTAPIVTVEWGRSLGVALFSQYNNANTTCPKPPAGTTVLEVRNYKGDTGGVGSALKIPALSDQVSFFISVP